MSAKSKRGEYEPSWTEVTIGALLSVILGAALGMVFLIFKPVMTIKDGKSTTVTTTTKTPKPGEKMPKPGETTVTETVRELGAGEILYFEGSRDSAKAKLVAAKRRTFVAGGSVSVDENELNSLVGAPTPSPAPAPAKPAPGAKKAPAAKDQPPPPAAKAGAPAPASGGLGFTQEAPNFRIHEGEFQIGLPLSVEAFGLEVKVIMQARGQFVKRGERFVFEPTTLLLGSCPLDPLPVARSLVVRKFINALPVPEDILKVWDNLSDVAVVGSALKLTMP
jgi:hypothetical protein